jgi:iron(III) transport system ATP-binding protein
MSSVRLQGLSKTFFDAKKQSSVVAVAGVDLQINQGEFITLLGPSGCGKTTVLRMLAGFERPTAGSVYFGDREVTHLDPQHRNSAMVFQSYALFPHMTVIQNVAYGLQFRKLTKEQKQSRLETIIQIVGLKGMENRRSSELSGGQQQRVALARSLVVEPDILLFDEPLSNLDVKLRESMRHEIRRIQSQLGITAVYVTHDQIEAMSLSDRIVVMNQGRVEQVDSPRNLFHLPKTRFVADFVGWTNFIDAEASAGGQVKTADISVKLEKEPSQSGKGWLSIRPENIRVSDSSSLKLKVTEASFLGDKTELRGSLPSGRDLILRLNSRECPRVGDVLGIELPTEELVFLPAA